MKRKFEKFKARRRRKGKEGGLGTKYSTLEAEETKTHKSKLKRPKHEADKPKVKKLKQTADSVCIVNSSVTQLTNEMMDLRPLIVEIFD